MVTSGDKGRRVCAFGVARQASFVFAFNGVPRCIMQGGKTPEENERDGDSLGSSLSSFRRSSDRFASPSRRWRKLFRPSVLGIGSEVCIMIQSVGDSGDQTGILNFRVAEIFRYEPRDALSWNFFLSH